MKKKHILCICLQIILLQLTYTATAQKTVFGSSSLKPRIVVLTDIAPADLEPDDMESMVRLFVHADLFEIEAVITSGGWNTSDRVYPISWKDSLSTVTNAYEKDLPNLIKRSGQHSFLPLKKESGKQKIGYWPSVEYLKSRSFMGSLELGQAKIGKENNSAGSDFIIQLLDEADDRPLWVLAWGGANTLAQALWKVKEERSEKELKTILHKLRVYTITDQDVSINDAKNFAFSSHQWMRKEFGKDLYFIWDESAWLAQNAIGSKNWEDYAKHIQTHGNLGAVYPTYKWGVEGDTPSFLHVLPNGLNDPNTERQTGWGGYFEWGMSRDGITSCYTNFVQPAKGISEKYENYFYPATFANFAARMDWAHKGMGNRNPVVIVNKKKGMNNIRINTQTGKTIKLDASKSFDPDNNRLSFHWWIMPESGTYTGTIKIDNSDHNYTTIKIPTDAAGKSFHVICEVTDDGEHQLKSYRRIIVEVGK
ncbi:hypothetical protein M2459_001853 [Parabacteroides sp. PF5-5]|uniref:DUF1593 domain-containing protein n=1 Tax=unclassified Parabacteroides TaxID=2649774 RepID=UPI0024734073|nr:MULTISPECIES: DUF1593 domain-containing protein [unclassified Parabacteroides]MDH6305400.1 hypothetical protein [Parabacteroides sp. PH5-39]MDH6316110.1 hypothetical protein [Parabacteroides sp. PF5-13]MDH6320260.1 hypothetical protein [Parabacteroides sp. PH5-13]MDH6323990.1 hypothetical protein [Parabacteroides sp. PH5-8]MDH6327301.1 hypothetical protein [Parabacteroides sp. PH5-41]